MMIVKRSFTKANYRLDGDEHAHGGYRRACFAAARTKIFTKDLRSRSQDRRKDEFREDVFQTLTACAAIRSMSALMSKR